MDQDATWYGGRPRPTWHCVRWGPSFPSPKGTQPPDLRPMSVVAKRLDGLRCHLTTWYGGRPRPRRRCDRWGHSTAPLKGAEPPVFGPCLLWPNGWMDEDATWCRSRPRPRPHCFRRGPSSPPHKRGTAAPSFLAHVYCGHGRPSELLLSSCINSVTDRFPRKLTMHPC